MIGPLDELLAPGGVHPLAVVVDLPLTDPDAELLLLRHVDAPVDDTRARSLAVAVQAARGLEIHLEVVLEPGAVAVAADLHAEPAPLEGRLLAVEGAEAAGVAPIGRRGPQLCAPLEVRLEVAVAALQAESLLAVARANGLHVIEVALDGLGDRGVVAGCGGVGLGLLLGVSDAARGEK